MKASEFMSSIPGITMDHLHNWERQGYIAPGRIKVGKKKIRDYSTKEVHFIKSMWSYYQQGLSPKNAHRNASEELSQSIISTVPSPNGHQETEERHKRENDSLEVIAIFELAIPLRNYFHLQMS
jgi:DNA-binding transcriptional MerR regulator